MDCNCDNPPPEMFVCGEDVIDSDEEDMDETTRSMISEESSRMDPGVEVEVLRHRPGYFHQMLRTGSFGIFRTDVAEKESWIRRRRYKALLGCVCLLVILLPAVIVPTRTRSSRTSSLTALNGDDFDIDLSFSSDEPIVDLFDDIFDGVIAGLAFEPFSTLDPVMELELPEIERSEDSSPSSRLSALQGSNETQAFPTNAWYQNLILLRDNETPNGLHRTYTMPYMVDAAGPIPGLRVHATKVETSSNQVIVSIDQALALTLGAAPNTFEQVVDPTWEKGYTFSAATDLGVTLQWMYTDMKSSLVRGMPYATMVYPSSTSSQILLPTIFGDRTPLGPLLIDGSQSVDCVDDTPFTINRDVELKLPGGRTWIVFFSQAVVAQCGGLDQNKFALQVLNEVTENERPLVIRVASVITPASGQTSTIFENSYKKLLRDHANIYPGDSTAVGYAPYSDKAALFFDWDAQYMDWNEGETTEMIMFAMPHHQDKVEFSSDYCTEVLVGSSCLVFGDTWSLLEDLPPISFRAPRLPSTDLLPDISAAVVEDLSYRVPDNFFRGAGDTYFSGKALGKLSRIILIADEILDTCAITESRSALRALVPDEFEEACLASTLPTRSAIDEALAHLREAVEVWLLGAAQAPFVYDSKWGGVVNCGCDFEFGNCINEFPDCPGLTDQGLNFGLGFYNDHHFHYGYHIYAAAVLARFDNSWGVRNFENVLLLIRDIANPSTDDPYFPTTRHKDWYHGSSWASGISQPPSATGMNQESSSEAIAGYEAVALFGKTMSIIFEDIGDASGVTTSDNVYEMGRLLAATEIRSTQRYWQITHEDPAQKTFQPAYEHNVVGILWSFKAFFGTWFGNDPYLMYGIQLLPLTPIAEQRDNVAWAREMFDPYAQTCDNRCVAEGWSVQILAILATLGQRSKAASYAQDLTEAVFRSPGGNGHSLSNTLWYIATRPKIDDPYVLESSYPWEAGPTKVTCQRAETCTDEVLDTMAGQYSCRDRITYLINSGSKSEYAACLQIAVEEYPDFCSLCSPLEDASGALDEPVESEGGVVNAPDVEVTAPTGDRITCGQPTRCTDQVLSAIAGTFPCQDRIEWLMRNKGLSEIQACEVVAANEFPDVCGGCNPAGG